VGAVVVAAANVAAGAPRLLLRAWLLAVAVSCVLVRQHVVIDVAAGALVGMAAWTIAHLRPPAGGAFVGPRRHGPTPQEDTTMTSKKERFRTVAVLGWILLSVYLVGSACRPAAAPGDFWADAILGQPFFSEITPGPMRSDRLFIAQGVIVDRRPAAGNNFYVYDAGHSRILAFPGSCLNSPPCVPSFVMGQPSFDRSACNFDSAFQDWPNRAPAFANTLCGLQESHFTITEGGSGASMAIDGSGNLYVTDYWNHRVLRYDDPFAPEEDLNADDVWGQADFTGNDCNRGAGPTASSFCFSWGGSNNWTAGVDIDPAGNLWVADSGNNRVLRFAPGSKTANLVLGQSSFWTGNPGTGPAQMWDPNSVRVNSNGWVYVSERQNDRVTVFQPPLTDGKDASITRAFAEPSGVDLDPTRPSNPALPRYVWISHLGNKTLELWNESLSGGIIDQVFGPGIGPLHDVSGSVGILSDGSLLAVPRDPRSTGPLYYWRRSGGVYLAPVNVITPVTPTFTDRDLELSVPAWLGPTARRTGWHHQPAHRRGLGPAPLLEQSQRRDDRQLRVRIRLAQLGRCDQWLRRPRGGLLHRAPGERQLPVRRHEVQSDRHLAAAAHTRRLARREPHLPDEHPRGRPDLGRPAPVRPRAHAGREHAVGLAQRGEPGRPDPEPARRDAESGRRAGPAEPDRRELQPLARAVLAARAGVRHARRQQALLSGRGLVRSPGSPVGVRRLARVEGQSPSPRVQFGALR
jgi:hypothetical protein